MDSADHSIIATILHILAGGLLGLLSASIAMAFGWRSADRLPGESRTPQCVYCYRHMTWRELFPLIGWLKRPSALSLPCPCGLRKGLWQQPVCEMLGIIMGMIAIYLLGWSWAAIPLCLGVGLLPAIAMIDLHFSIIPDGLNLLLGLFGFIFAISKGEDFYLSLSIAAVLLMTGLFFAITYSKWRGKEMLGMGDVKFFAAAGFWLTPMDTPWFLALSGIIGIIFHYIWKRINNDKQFPFAPALCISLALCVLYRMSIAS